MKGLKMISKSVFFLMLILLISCNEPTEEQTTISQNQEIAQEVNHQLTVIGHNINLLTAPNGQPFGQAQDGEVYEVLDATSNFETIGRETDFWYQVEKMGEKVWIFGAFTSKNLNDNAQVFQGIYSGSEWGDYFHLNFRTENDEFYMDFGEGANYNNYGDYDLEKDEAKYKGKTFNITWKVLMTETYAGEGSMDLVEREVPYIVDLALVE
jgi:hypothetical protein